MNSKRTTQGRPAGRLLAIAASGLVLAALTAGGALAARELTGSGESRSGASASATGQRPFSVLTEHPSDNGSPPAVTVGLPPGAPGSAEAGELVADPTDTGSLEEVSYLTESSFECSQGGGAISFSLPWENAGDYHQFWFRVDGGQWSYTNWYYSEGFNHRLEYSGGYWGSVLSGMTFSILRGTHFVEAWEYRSSVGWIDMGTCQTWDTASGGVSVGRCDPSSPNYRWEPVPGFGYCEGY